jgi:hypothetical protein
MWATGTGQGPVAGCCECGDEPSCSGATELVMWVNGAMNTLCTNLGFRGDVNTDGGLLCYVIQYSGCTSTFRRNTLPPSSAMNIEAVCSSEMMYTAKILHV